MCLYLVNTITWLALTNVIICPTPQGARLCVTQLLGYRISSGDLLREALTHCSWPAGPCYQRLEFLGDALLDLCASDIIWREGDRLGSGWGRVQVVVQVEVVVVVGCLCS